MESEKISFNFYTPIQLRYSDLDTLLHVNNVAIISFFETARTRYYEATGIWDGVLRNGFGMVVASVKVDYLQTIQYGSELRVGVKVAKLGSKSLRFLCQLESPAGEVVYARGEVTMVSFDQSKQCSRPVPQEWRETLAKFENNPELLQ